MRYMVIVKNDPQTEGMEMPAEQMTEMFATMGRYNEQLADAGVMLAGEGLLPSTEGFKVRFDGEQRAVVDGPFTGRLRARGASGRRGRRLRRRLHARAARAGGPHPRQGRGQPRRRSGSARLTPNGQADRGFVDLASGPRS